MLGEENKVVKTDNPSQSFFHKKRSWNPIHVDECLGT